MAKATAVLADRDVPPVTAGAAPRAVWESLARSGVHNEVSHDPAWGDAARSDGRYEDVSLLYEFQSGRQVVLPMLRRRRLPARLATVEAWPYPWGAAGPVTTGEPFTDGEAAAVFADLAARRPLTMRMMLGHRADGAWLRAAGQFEVEAAPCYVVDLAGGFDTVWTKRFRPVARTAVRKAERSGLDIEADRSGRQLGVFCDLFEKSIERWAAMQHEPRWLTRHRMARDTSPDKLAAVAGAFGDNCTTWVARSRGEPVAAIIVVRSGNCAKFWRGAMDKAGATRVRANELLHKLAIEELCRDGGHCYEMGFARPGGSLAAFKEKLGASLHYTHTLRAERLPLHRADRLAREAAKKMIGFRDV